MLTHKRLLDLLIYEPFKGDFFWKESNNQVSTKDPAGSVRSDGYIRITIDGKPYYANVLAWFYMLGEMPPKGFDVDHQNRNKSDNSWYNLRLLTRSRNKLNADSYKSNTSGHRGVTRQQGKWLARISVDGKRHILGFYDTFDEAVKVRQAAEANLEEN